MRFNEEKKQAIMLYILEKVEQGDDGLSKKVSEAFDINQNTAHTYINELVDKKIIERVMRGKYKLVNQEYKYVLSRGNGDLDSDTYAYSHILSKYIKDLPSNVKEIWGYAFSEMINNVMDHSQAEYVNLIIRQNYLNTTVYIADDGIGIFEKIKEHFHFESLDDAISELFKGKLTTDSHNHSGEGIFFSSRLMDEFFIVSSGKIFTHNKYDNSMIFDVIDTDIKGTCVIMSLSNYSHKKSIEVFDLYSNEDGGFDKTKIPLKNIFDTSPVSRSQAKRICNRLEKFREVVIDFQDIEWMGQGFAHQLFIIFAKEHPETTLLPVNMNEDVTKMYNHVVLTK